MEKNKKIESVFSDKEKFNILGKEIEVHLEITRGDIYDVVKARDLITNPVSIGEIDELLIGKVIDKWNLKEDNTVWIEDFTEVSESKMAGENLNRVSFTKKDGKILTALNKDFITLEDYDNFLAIAPPVKKTTTKKTTTTKKKIKK